MFTPYFRHGTCPFYSEGHVQGRPNKQPVKWSTLEPRFAGTSLLPTVLSLSPGKGLTLSLNSTRLIRTPVNTDHGHFFLAQSTDFHRTPTSLKRTFHYQLCSVTDLSFVKEGKKTVVNVPNSTVHRIK